MARRERDEASEDPVKELMAQVLRRELPVRIHSFTPVEIQAIFRLQDEFGFYFTVEHGFEAYFIADELARRGVPVVYGPTTGPAAAQDVPAPRPARRGHPAPRGREGRAPDGPS